MCRMTRRSIFLLGLSAAPLGAQKGFAVRKAADKFYGAWRLLEYPRMGVDPIGRLAYDALGRMYLQVIRRDRPRFASGTREGTPGEIHDAWMGSLSYYGNYLLNAERQMVLHHIEACSFPNWVESDQELHYAFEGDNLILTAALDGREHRSVWRHIR
ncbi:MAG TPA: hypothetical protein DEQ47_01245 [Solibacterales bacterium]|nr:hypothetical protein [Bryobacterales bacterium]